MSAIEPIKSISREQSDVLGWTKRHHNSKDPARIFDLGITTPNGCLEYQGHLNESGYGLVSVNGRPYLTHRVSYLLKIGPIPDGLQVLHTCDNPPCINHEHFFLGTNLDNVKDKVSKGRQSSMKGEKHKMAKLTDEQVIDLRTRYDAGGVLQEELAEELGMSLAQVHRIINRQAWDHL